MIRKLQIGDVQLENNLILAPMAGVTDLPFRLLCKEQGAGLLCMEMVSAKAILYNNKNTEALMAIDDREPPVSLQLFGSDPDVISEMAKRIEERPFSILDINMGCPVPKVTGNGEGSALMKNPKLVEEIITKTARAIRKPVTVKIRKGFDESHVNAVEIAKIAEASGAAAVAVHGRTREQYYSGKADWDIIRQVKEAVKIPVIGNGDVTSAESADAIMRETGCDDRQRCPGKSMDFPSDSALDGDGRTRGKADPGRSKADDLKACSAAGAGKRCLHGHAGNAQARSMVYYGLSSFCKITGKSQ